MLVALYLYLKAMPCVHGKLVNDDLAEEPMVAKGLHCCLDARHALTLSQIAIDDAAALAKEEAEGHYKDEGEGIKHAHIGVPKHTDEFLMHPRRSKRGAFPTLCGSSHSFS